MAIIEFQDRKVQFPGRCTLTNVNTMEQMVVDVQSSEGVVTQEGTTLNKDVMDRLAQKEVVDSQLNSINNALATKAVKIDVDASINSLQANVESKANKSEVNASISSINSVLNSKANKNEVDSSISTLNASIVTKVNKTTSVNGKALTDNIILTCSDIGAEPIIGSKLSAFNKNFGTASDDVCRGSDDRLSNSRKCNNTFDNIETAKTNLGLHNVASSGNYNDLINKPTILNNYDIFPAILTSAIAGFSNLNNLTTNSNTITKTLNYKKKYCFYNYGGYTAGMILSVSGGYWQSEEMSYASNLVVIPEYTGSMGGSQKRFQFITSDGMYYYVASGSDITISISRPDCFAYSEVTLYTYY